jgi:hypothetical protein
MRAASVLLVGLLALLLAGCAGLIGGDPARLVLAPGDLPSGFARAAAGPYSDADVARTFGLTLAQVRGTLGRRAGYRAVFRGGGPILRVDSTVSLYRGAVAADKALGFELRANRAANPAARPLSLPRIGQRSQALAWGATDARTHAPLTVVAVYWRQNNALAAVVAVGAPGAFQPEQVLRLARIQEEKLRRAA